MTERKAIKKSVRFDVFKRDHFTCQYCGNQPPTIVLVIDHIHSVKDGGDNDIMNLITSCEACNQGKAAKKLDIIPNRPDAHLEWLEMQQEIAELRRYQVAKSERDKALMEIARQFQDDWFILVDSQYCPTADVWIKTLIWAAPDLIDKAIKIVGAKSGLLKTYDSRFRYFMGVLHHLVTEAE